MVCLLPGFFSQSNLNMPRDGPFNVPISFHMQFKKVSLFGGITSYYNCDLQYALASEMQSSVTLSTETCGQSSISGQRSIIKRAQ